MMDKYTKIKNLSDARSAMCQSVYMLGCVINNIDGNDDHYQRYDPAFNTVTVNNGSHKLFSTSCLPESVQRDFLVKVMELFKDTVSVVENKIDTLQ